MLEILKMINDYLKTSTQSKLIHDLKMKNFYETNIIKKDYYDNYNLYQFISLYKIERLEALNIIGKEESESLKELLIKYINITKEINTSKSINNLLYPNNNIKGTKIEKLEKKKQEFAKILSIYNLVPDYITIEKIIDTIILNEKYSNKDINNNINKSLKK